MKITRATTASELSQAYRLVHDVYLQSGFITKDPRGIRIRLHEANPETATFVAKFGGKVVGVLSVAGYSSLLGLPSDGVFHQEFERLLARKPSPTSDGNFEATMDGLPQRRVCEMTNQAVAPEYRKSAVSTELMRCAFAFAFAEGYDDAVATISPSHRGFYELLGFHQIGEQRSYSKNLDDPVIAVATSLDRFYKADYQPSGADRLVHEFFTVGNSYIDRIESWAAEARAQFSNAEFIRSLFITESEFFLKCSVGQTRILKALWGPELCVNLFCETLHTNFSPALARHETLEEELLRLAALRREPFQVPAEAATDTTGPASWIRSILRWRLSREISSGSKPPSVFSGVRMVG